MIEDQNREEKDRVWEQIQRKEAERLAVEQKTQPVFPKAKVFSWKKWTAVAASSLAAVFLGTFAVIKFFPFNNGGENEGRYFTAVSYDAVTTETTLKEYAEDIGKNLLYFDWYAETDHLKDYVWQLKDTQEIICFNEEIVDVETGSLVYIFVLEADIQVESFSLDESTDRKSEINGISVDWREMSTRAYANFEYEGYRYYLRVKDPADENYILTLVEELLP